MAKVSGVWGAPGQAGYALRRVRNWLSSCLSPQPVPKFSVEKEMWERAAVAEILLQAWWTELLPPLDNPLTQW